MPTIRQIVNDAALEIGVVSIGDPPPAEITETLVFRLNRLLDEWNAQHEAMYAQQFLTYTLVPSLAPHTIGPTGATWTTPVRPVSIESAQLVLDISNPSTYTPIRLRTAQWWGEVQMTPTLESGYPTDLYYEPAWPNGNLNFWVVPTIAYQVQLQVRRLFASVVSTDDFSLPPGYQSAVTLTLAEQSAVALGRELSGALVSRASQARARIFANNVEPRHLITQDSGMPTAQKSSTFPTFNYLIGS
jgi:hypothetical protein